MKAPRSVLFLVGWVAVVAVTDVAAQVPGAAEQSEALLVLEDGRVLSGKISRHAAGCFVERPSGTILIATEQIRCVARDLKDAYRLQRDQLVDPTSMQLVGLAEWCISYRLYDEAGDELRRALRREPGNDVARQMLGRLEDMVRAKPAPKVKTSPDPYGNLAPDVEALGGMSRTTAADFTSRVQPLLINKCGNASCHGSEATNEFRLQHVRIGTSNHRRFTEQNLAMVLKYVDLQQPQQSPLLKVTSGQHGNSSLSIFGGAAGTSQERLLRGWLQTVADEKQAESERYAARVPLRKSSRATATAAAPAADTEPALPGRESSIQLAKSESFDDWPPPSSAQPPSGTLIPSSALPLSGAQPTSGMPVPSGVPARQNFDAEARPINPAAAVAGEMPRPTAFEEEPPARDAVLDDEAEPPPLRRDPFDPEYFNRHFGVGRARR